MPPGSRIRFPIAILTDFGYRDHYVGAMKGVIATIAADATLIDLTHGVPPQSVIAGAIALRESWRYFPRRTVFLAVVDPGVGTARLPIAIETRAGARFVGPDNGLLWLAANDAGIRRAVKLTSRRHRLEPVSSTFHGRDIFAPAAAWLWRGTRIASLGPRLEEIKHLDLPRPVRARSAIRGEVIYIDGFGNLVTNLDRETVARFAACFPDKSLSVRIDKGAMMKIHEAYADAPTGAALATFGSFGTLEIAVRERSAAERLFARLGTQVMLVLDRR
jgi:S-adenosyl-L-methionine hydrolase (adenosine-forming)